MNITIGNPRCPICHSTKVKGYKVLSGKTWWHHCISGSDHGTLVTPDGIEREWPETIYFTDAGTVETPWGNFRIERQMRK